MLKIKRKIPSPDDVKQRYQSKAHSENYIKFRANDNANYRYLHSYFDMVTDLAVQRAPARILDLGCGSGPLLSRLRHRLPDTHMIGFDVSHHLLREVQSIPLACPVQGDAFTLPFADQSFDMVTCVAVAELFNDRDFMKVLHELKRVACPGGHLIVMYRNPYSLWEPYWWMYKYPYYQNAYSLEKLRFLAQRMSLPIEQSRGTYLAAPPLIYRNHQAFYRDWIPEWFLNLARRVDCGILARGVPWLCRHFIVVHRVPKAAGAGARRNIDIDGPAAQV